MPGRRHGEIDSGIMIDQVQRVPGGVYNAIPVCQHLVGRVFDGPPIDMDDVGIDLVGPFTGLRPFPNDGLPALGLQVFMQLVDKFSLGVLRDSVGFVTPTWM